MAALHRLANQVWKLLRHPAEKEACDVGSFHAENVEQPVEICFHARGHSVPQRNWRRRRDIENMEPVLYIDGEDTTSKASLTASCRRRKFAPRRLAALYLYDYGGHRLR